MRCIWVLFKHFGHLKAPYVFSEFKVKSRRTSCPPWLCPLKHPAPALCICGISLPGPSASVGTKRIGASTKTSMVKISTLGFEQPWSVPTSWIMVCSGSCMYVLRPVHILVTSGHFGACGQPIVGWDRANSAAACNRSPPQTFGVFANAPDHHSAFTAHH